MIYLSLNIRGVGEAPKMISLRRLLEIVKPDIIFIQETMVSRVKAREVFTKLSKDKDICATDSIGKSGGLLSA